MTQTIHKLAGKEYEVMLALAYAQKKGLTSEAEIRALYKGRIAQETWELLVRAYNEGQESLWNFASNIAQDIPEDFEMDFEKTFYDQLGEGSLQPFPIIVQSRQK